MLYMDKLTINEDTIHKKISELKLNKSPGPVQECPGGDEVLYC